MLMRLFVWTLAASPALFSQAPPPISLDQALQEALAGNLDLLASRYSIGVAAARQITASLRPNPVVSLSGDHLDVLGTGYNSVNNGGPNEYALRTDFVLERGGKRAARIEVAAAEKTVAELGFQDALRRLVYDVQTAFVDVQLANENLTLARDNLRMLEGIVAINTVRVRSGDLAGVELNRSQVAEMQYQTAVRQAELQARQAKERLQFLLGRSARLEGFDVAGPIRRSEPQMRLDNLHTLALDRRPDLLQVRQSQLASQAGLRLQIAQGKIDYTAGVEYRRQQASTATGNSLGVFLSAPLPVFARNQGEIARARQEVDQSAARIRALTARVGSEVNDAWNQYSTARALLAEIEEKLLAKARDVRQTTEYSYRRGEATLVEFLDAQRAFNEVMQSHNQARAGFAQSLFLIDSVTAASIQPQPPAPTP